MKTSSVACLFLLLAVSLSSAAFSYVSIGENISNANGTAILRLDDLELGTHSALVSVFDAFGNVVFQDKIAENQSAIVEVPVPYRFTTPVGDYIDRTLGNRATSDDIYSIDAVNETDPNANPFDTEGGTTLLMDENLYRIGAAESDYFADATVTDPNSGDTYTETQNVWIKGTNEFSSVDNVVQFNPTLFVYNIKFDNPAHTGIPVCSEDANGDGNWADCNHTRAEYVGKHRVNVNFLGDTWLISDLYPPVANVSNSDELIAGGNVTLMKEGGYGIANIGDGIASSDGKVRAILKNLTWQEVPNGITGAIVSFMDNSNHMISLDQVFVNGSLNKTINGQTVRIRLNSASNSSMNISCLDENGTPFSTHIVNLNAKLNNTCGANFKLRYDAYYVGVDTLNLTAHISFTNSSGGVAARIAIADGGMTTQSIGGRNYTLKVYQIDPGYTFGTRWAEMAFIDRQVALVDGDVLDNSDNYEWNVNVLWKNRDAAETNASTKAPDSLRSIILYKNAFGAAMAEGDKFNIIENPVAYAFGYQGLDLSASDYDTLKYAAGGPVTLSMVDGTTCRVNANGYIKVTSTTDYAFRYSGVDEDGDSVTGEDKTLWYLIADTGGGDCESDGGLAADAGDIVMKANGSNKNVLIDTDGESPAVEYKTAGDAGTGSEGGAIRISGGSTPLIELLEDIGTTTDASTGAVDAHAVGVIQVTYNGALADSFADNNDGDGDQVTFGISTVDGGADLSSVGYVNEGVPADFEEGHFTSPRGTQFESMSSSLVQFKVAKKTAAARYNLMASNALDSCSSSITTLILAEGQMGTVDNTNISVNSINEVVGTCSSSGGSCAVRNESVNLTVINTTVVLAEGKNVTIGAVNVKVTSIDESVGTCASSGGPCPVSNEKVTLEITAAQGGCFNVTVGRTAPGYTFAAKWAQLDIQQTGATPIPQQGSVISIGEALNNTDNTFSARLDDIEAGTRSAIVSILDSDGNVVAQDKVHEGRSIIKNTTSQRYRITLYQLAPGYTFGAKWARIGIDPTRSRVARSQGYVVNVSDRIFNSNGTVSVRLDDLEVGSRNAIVSLLDSNGITIAQEEIRENGHVDANISGQFVRVRVYQTAAGYTFAAKWAKMSIDNIGARRITQRGNGTLSIGDSLVNPNGSVRIRLDDLEDGSRSAVLSILDSNGSTIYVDKVAEGRSIVRNVSGQTYRIMVYQTAAGYTFSAKWAKLGIEPVISAVTPLNGNGTLSIGDTYIDDAGLIRVRLDDIEITTHAAIISVMDSNGDFVMEGGYKLAPGSSISIPVQALTGEPLDYTNGSYVITVYETAPGYTFGAEWARVGIALSHNPVSTNWQFQPTNKGDSMQFSHLDGPTYLATLDDLEIDSRSAIISIRDSNLNLVSKLKIAEGKNSTVVVEGDPFVCIVNQTAAGYTFGVTWAKIRLQ